MCDSRALELVAEIRDLHARHCRYAEDASAAWEAQARRMVDPARVRDNARIPEIRFYPTTFAYHEDLLRAQNDPRVLARFKVVQSLKYCLMLAIIVPVVLSTDSLLAALAAAIGPGALMLWLDSRWQDPRIRRVLREQLRARGVPICIHCGYDLRGQQPIRAESLPRCPECGRVSVRGPAAQTGMATTETGAET